VIATTHYPEMTSLSSSSVSSESSNISILKDFPMFVMSDPGSALGNKLLTFSEESITGNKKYVSSAISFSMKGKLFIIPQNVYFDNATMLEMVKLINSYKSNCLYQSNSDDFEKLIKFLSRNLSYLIESSQHWRANWDTLKYFANQCSIKNDEWITNLFNNELKRCSVKGFRSWARVLKEVGLDAYANQFTELGNVKEKTQLAANSLSNDEIHRLLAKEARQSLLPSQQSAVRFPYSSIKLDVQNCSNIISKLGRTYDLSKLIENSDKDALFTKLTLHRKLVTCLNTFGMKLSSDFKLVEKVTKSKLSKCVTMTKSAPLATILGMATPAKEKDMKELINMTINFLLSKNEYMILSSKCDSSSSNDGLKLDPWQAKMVASIKQNASVLVIGPTSGGKTFTSMAALEWITSAHSSDSLIYTAPTFHLALQTYSNITKSFPQKTVGLITGIINSIPSKKSPGTIWVGTSSELFNYLQATQTMFTIGIFDEVHTIAENFTDGTLASKISSHATVQLMKMCSKQLIALSATISDSDALRLCEYFQTITNLQIENIIYRDRIIPITEYQFNGDSITKLSSISEDIQKVSVTADNSVKLLNMMKANKQFPVLIFDESDADCLSNYRGLIDYLKERDSIDYSNWHHFNDVYTSFIEDYNNNILALQEEHSNDDIKKSKSRLLRDVLMRNLSKPLKEFEENKSMLIKTEPDYARDMTLLCKALSSVNDFDLMPIICEGVGSQYRFSEQSSEFSRFKKMLIAPREGEHGKNREDEKIHTLMNLLLKAEGLSVEEVKLISIITTGLNFGIGIILPTMPFFVQYEMLRLLDSGKLNVVFGSQSFHMGVNYPLRSVVIRQNEVKKIDIATALQMGGRCGRRRLDTEGHVFYWNIKNSADIKTINLPSMILPDPKELTTCRIKDHLTTMVNIELSRNFLGGGDMSNSKGCFDFIEAIANPIGEAIDIEQIYTLLERVKRFLDMRPGSDLIVDAYAWSERIAEFERAIAELHVRYHLCSNVELLNMLSSTGNILRSVMHKQIFMA